MKTRSIIFFIMLLIGFNCIAQSSKTTSKPKTKSTASKSTKPKQPVKTQQSTAIPADAFYFKDSNNKTATITTAYKAIVVEGDGNHIDIGDGSAVIFVKGKNNDIN